MVRYKYTHLFWIFFIRFVKRIKKKDIKSSLYKPLNTYSLTNRS